MGPPDLIAGADWASMPNPFKGPKGPARRFPTSTAVLGVAALLVQTASLVGIGLLVPSPVYQVDVVISGLGELPDLPNLPPLLNMDVCVPPIDVGPVARCTFRIHL